MRDENPARPPQNHPARLRAEGLCVVTPGGRALLRDVSVRVEKGEWIGVVGLNGAGKSTLLRALLGLEALAQGDVWVGDAEGGERALAEMTPAEKAKALGFVPQRLAVVPGILVADAVMQGFYAQTPRRGGADTLSARAQNCLEMVQAKHLGGQRLDQLSGGELQRVLIAAALAQGAPCVLLDEPTSALDVSFAPQLLALLGGLRRTQGLSLVTATHDLNLASLYCDRLLLLHQGQVVASGTPSEVLHADVLGRVYGMGALLLLAHPQHPGHVQVLPKHPDKSAALPSASEPTAPETPHAHPQNRHRWRILGALGLALLLSLVLTPTVGAVSLDLWAALADGPNAHTPGALIFWKVRLPRTLMAAMTGGGLAVAGASFQALLRNALATPYTLGIAGGASVGAVSALLITAHYSIAVSTAGPSPLAFGAFLGAGLSTLLVLALGKSLGGSSVYLLLAGIACSMVSSAAVLLLQHLGGPGVLMSSSRWLVGGLDGTQWASVWQTLQILALGLVLTLRRAPDLNLIALDDALAATRGVDIVATQRQVLIGTSLGIAALIAQVGPIGFVGLIIPHSLRPLVGEDQRVLLPSCLLAGATFLIFCDVLARTLLAPNELPVGVLTALLGGPFLVWTLVRQQRRAAG